MFKTSLKLIVPLIVVIALLTTAGIVFGRRTNATVMTVASIIPPVGNLTLAVIDADSGLQVPMDLNINGVGDLMFSDDASRLLLFSGGDQARLHMVDLATGEQYSAPDAYILGAGFQQGRVTWSPDGRYVMFTTAFIPGQEAQGVYVMDFDLYETRRIHETQVFAHWSPDSRYMAYAFDGDIHLIDVATGERRNLTQNDHWHRTPQWTPDGMLIFEGTDFDESREIIFMLDPHVENADLIRLTEAIYTGDDPLLSPDGRYVTFSGYETAQSPTRILYNLDLETGEMYSLPVSEILPVGGAWVVRWSPDSQRMLIGVSVGSTNSATYATTVSDPYGNIAQEVTEMSIIHGWSTDSEQILYALSDDSSTTFQLNLYATPADAMQNARLLVQTAEYALPQWTTSGEALAYIRRETVSTRVGNSASNRNMVFTSRVYMDDLKGGGRYITLPETYAMHFGYWQ